jgi:hypothetical protein
LRKTQYRRMLDNVHVELFWAALVGAVASMTGA